MDYVSELKATIKRLHQCEDAHTLTEYVKEVVNGQLLFDGRVEVFALAGHDRALRCYAWGHLDDSGRWEVTTVLAIPPVISASTAVLAAIAAKIKEREQSAGETETGSPPGRN